MPKNINISSLKNEFHHAIRLFKQKHGSLKMLEKQENQIFYDSLLSKPIWLENQM